MKREYYVCDRCGKEIKPVFLTSRYISVHTQIVKTDVKLVNDIKQQIQADNENDSLELKFLVGNRFDGERYDLCGKCRKDFERFMRDGKSENQN